jgi:hypothetical protein
MSDETYADRQLSLVHELYKRTRERKINWAKSRYGYSFEAGLSGYLLRISLQHDNDYPDDPDFFLSVIDISSGSEILIDTISNKSLRPVADKKTADGLNPYAVLSEIYELARRQVLNVDDTLERVLSTLRQT